MSQMDIICLFMQRKESYEGQHAPELIDAVDEWTIENGYDYEHFFELKKQKYRDEGEAAGFAVVRFAVDQDKIRQRCLDGGLRLEAREVEQE